MQALRRAITREKPSRTNVQQKVPLRQSSFRMSSAREEAKWNRVRAKVLLGRQWLNELLHSLQQRWINFIAISRTNVRAYILPILLSWTKAPLLPQSTTYTGYGLALLIVTRLFIAAQLADGSFEKYHMSLPMYLRQAESLKKRALPYPRAQPPC